MAGGAIWAMKDGDAVATQFAGDDPGLADAKAYVGSNGTIFMPPGTEGVSVGAIPAGVNIVRDSAGVATRFGVSAFAGSPVFDVKAFGALGDGSTDDTSAINDAISAAEAIGGIVLFPPSSGEYITATGGFVLKRSTQVWGYGATLKLTSASAVLFTIGSGVLNDFMSGGIYGLALSGAGGSSDTSIGIQIGNSATDTVFATNYRDLWITMFGTGVYLTTAETNHGSSNCTFYRARINFNAICAMECDADGGLVEHFVLSDCFIQNNGESNAAGAGIKVTGSGKLSLTLVNCTIHNNGDGTLASMLDCESGTIFVGDIIGCDAECNGDPDRFLIRVIGDTGGINRLNIVNSRFSRFNGSDFDLPLMILSNTDLITTGLRLTKTCGSTTGIPWIDLGASLTGVPNTWIGSGTTFAAGGTVANAQLLATTGSYGSHHLNVTGSQFYQCDSATDLTAINPEAIGTYDLVKPALNVSTAQHVVMTGLELASPQDNRRRVSFETVDVPIDTTALMTCLYRDSQVLWKIPVIATANLPGNGVSANDGFICFEDNGVPGTYPLVYFVGGQRYKVAGVNS